MSADQNRSEGSTVPRSAPPSSELHFALRLAEMERVQRKGQEGGCQGMQGAHLGWTQRGLAGDSRFLEI